MMLRNWTAFQKFMVGIIAFATFFCMPAMACNIYAPIVNQVCSGTDVHATQPDLTGYFMDVRFTEFWQHVRILAVKDIINRELFFRVDSPATRAEGLKMLIKGLDVAKPGWRSRSTSLACNFVDVRSSDWFRGFVSDAVSQGLISCQQDFRPNDPITRQEFAKIAYKALLLLNPEKENTPVKEPEPFTDAGAFDASLLPYAEKLRANGILSGYPDGTFKPLENISRGQIAKIIANSYFPVEGGMEFSLGNPALPSSYFVEPNRIHVTTPSASFEQLVVTAQTSTPRLDFKQYKNFSPDVAYAAALMSVAAYEDDEKLKQFLEKFGFEFVTSYSGVLAGDGFRFFLARRTIPDPVQATAPITQYVLSVRGTDNINNIVTDAYIVPTNCTGVHGTLHSGFCDLAKTVWHKIIGTSMQKAITETDLLNNTLTITGHSLGGAAAAVLHGMMTDDSYIKGNRIRAWGKIQTYTIGAPVSGYSNFAENYADQRIFRVRREEDWVANVGAVKGTHIGQQHGFAHIFTQQSNLTAPGSLSTGEVYGKIFEADYRYVDYQTEFPSPERIGVDHPINGLPEHGSLGYTDMLRTFLSTEMAKVLRNKQEMVFPQ